MHTIKAEGRRTGPRVRYTVYKNGVFIVSLRSECTSSDCVMCACAAACSLL